MSSLTDSSYASRPFRESDLDSIIRLRSLVFGKDKALSFKRNWKWYFRENPVLESYRPKSWIVENKAKDDSIRSNSKIAGYISITPSLLKIGSKQVKFTWGGDLMSDPDKRGKGIGKEMVRRWKEEANICLALGVGDVAYGIESSMGWADIGIGKAMIKILDAGKFIDYAMKTKKSMLSSLLSKPFNIFLRLFFRAKKSKHADDLSIAEIRRFDRSFDDFWAEVSGDLGISVVRDSEYLNWKYTQNPSRKFRIFAATEKKTGKIRGYIVLAKMQSENFSWGRIVDFVVSPTDKKSIQLLISFAVGHFEKEKCDGIQVYGMKKEHRNLFRKNGFMYSKQMSQRFIVKIDDVKKDNLPRMDYFRNPDNWFITAGDSDFTS